MVGLCPGYRHVGLRNEMGQPLPCSTLFLKITVKDYVPDGLSDFAEALANPIKFQSDLDKRTKQLAVFTDEIDQNDSCAVSIVIMIIVDIIFILLSIAKLYYCTVIFHDVRRNEEI